MRPVFGDPRLVVQTEDVIGEVPHWHGPSGTLLWIDILKPALHRLDAGTGRVATVTPPEKLGSFGLAEDGRLIVGGRGGIGLWDGGVGAIARLGHPEEDRPDNILNDGRSGPDGRFLTASMNKRLAGPTGRLWQVHRGGAISCLQDGGIDLPNAICWSPDGRSFYLGDSHTNLIFVHDYDLDTGAISNRRLFADTADLPGDVDGASVDSEGFLWNARFGGGCLVRFAPDGRVDRRLELPVRQPTHVTFGGPDLTTLYVTTARFRQSEADLAAQPWAGGVLAIESDLRGLPETPFRL